MEPEKEVVERRVRPRRKRRRVTEPNRTDDPADTRNAISDAAGIGGGLWLSYIFVLFYLFVAAAGVTHRDLLFESPVKLPFLNVDLPLTSFFSLGPGLLLIVHTYVLLHLVLLAGKVGYFNAELEAQISEDDEKEGPGDSCRVTSLSSCLQGRKRYV